MAEEASLGSRAEVKVRKVQELAPDAAIDSIQHGELM